MKKPEQPTPDTWTPEVAKHVQGYLECMTPRPWTQGSSTHEVVRHPDGYHVFDCHHGRDGQGAAYIVNAMPAAMARIRELEGALKPFAAEAETWDDDRPDSNRFSDHPWHESCTNEGDPMAFTLGDLRRAARALKGGSMRITARCTSVKITPSDASGFFIDIEVSDRTEIIRQSIHEMTEAEIDAAFGKENTDRAAERVRRLIDRTVERTLIENLSQLVMSLCRQLPPDHEWRAKAHDALKRWGVFVSPLKGEG